MQDLERIQFVCCSHSTFPREHRPVCATSLRDPNRLLEVCCSGPRVRHRPGTINRDITDTTPPSRGRSCVRGSEFIPVFQEVVLAQALVMGLLSDVKDEHVWRHPRSWGRMPSSKWHMYGRAWVRGGCHFPAGALGEVCGDGAAPHIQRGGHGACRGDWAAARLPVGARVAGIGRGEGARLQEVLFVEAVVMGPLRTLNVVVIV